MFFLPSEHLFPRPHFQRQVVFFGWDGTAVTVAVGAVGIVGFVEIEGEQAALHVAGTEQPVVLFARHARQELVPGARREDLYIGHAGTGARVGIELGLPSGRKPLPPGRELPPSRGCPFLRRRRSRSGVSRLAIHCWYMPW